MKHSTEKHCTLLMISANIRSAVAYLMVTALIGNQAVRILARMSCSSWSMRLRLTCSGSWLARVGMHLIVVNLLVRCNEENYGKMNRRLQIGKVWEGSWILHKSIAQVPVKMAAWRHSGVSCQSRG
jgi:hypothetical protein